MKEDVYDIFEKKMATLGRNLATVVTEYSELRNFMSDNKLFSKPDYTSIIEEVCKNFCIEVQDFMSRNQDRIVVDARKCFVFITVNMYKFSINEIMEVVGRHRSTYYNAYKKHFALYEFDPDYREQFLQTITNLNLKYDHEAEIQKKEIVEREVAEKGTFKKKKIKEDNAKANPTTEKSGFARATFGKQIRRNATT